MGFWFTLFLWAVGFVLSDYFRPKLPAQEPSGEGDFQSPTATEGRKVPQVVGGTVKINGPNTLWQGDWDAEPVTVETGMIFKRDETVGYKYSVSLALGQFMGECAGMTAIWIGDDRIWDYVEDNGGVVATVADVDLPDLFGGEKEGGGFSGRIRCFTGSNSQSVSTFLQSRIPLQSAWPGLTYVVISDLTETAGASIGEQNTLRDIRIEFQMYKELADGDLGNGLSLTGDTHFIGRDANPIEAAYKVLNDVDWGIATNEVNYTNFQTVAQTCYDEGIGYSQTIDNELEAYAVLAEIEKHIDGYIGPNPQTGLIEVKLARADYTAANEFQANETNIIAINNYAKPEWPQTKNEVKVRFLNRDKEYNDDHAVAQDMAGRLITGRPQSITVRFPGLRDAAAANRIVTRASRSYFWPLAKFQLEMDRTAYAIRPGDILVVTHPDIGAVNLNVRASRTQTGDPVKQTIKIDVVSDVFEDEAGMLAAPPASEWTPADDQPVALSNYTIFNAPRHVLDIQEQAQENRLLWLVERDAPNSGWKLRLRTRATPFGGGFSSEYFEGPFTSFTPYGTLRANGISSPEIGLGMLQDTTNTGAATLSEGGVMYVDGALSGQVGTFTPASFQDGLIVINPGQANEEFVCMSTCTVSGAGVECSGLIRGIGDSPILEHAVGEPVWFLDSGSYLQPVQLENDDSFSLDHKHASIAPGGETAESAWQGEILVDDAAITRPFPPTAVIFDQISTTIWYADGDLDASEPNSFTAPSTQGVAMEVWNRDFTQSNHVQGARSARDTGIGYGTNYFAAYAPQINWYIYDLDANPTPVRGDEVMSGTVPGMDDPSNNFTIDQTEFQNSVGATSPLNGRIEYTWENTTSPGVDGVLAGVESRSVFVDKVITFTNAELSYEMAQDTLLLLHFSGASGTTEVYDYSFNNHPVTLSGNLEISQAVADDDFVGQSSPEESPLYVYPAGHLSLTTQDTESPETSPLVYNYCEVTNISPEQFTPANMDQANGYMIQARVRFSTTPSGEIPLVTKWRTGDNERQFWFGLNNTTLRMKHSNDGTAELIETTGTRTWNVNQWYEITATVTDQYVQFFVDGVFDEAEFHSWGTAHDSAAPVRIGADGDGNTVNQNMRIDEVRITKIPVYQAPWTKLTRPYAGRELVQTLHCNWENAVGSPGAQEYISDDLNEMPIMFPTLGSTDTRIDTSQSKFGTQSLHCGGAASSSGVSYNDGVWIPGTSAPGVDRDGTGSKYDQPSHFKHVTDFGRRDFTMECFIRFATLPSASGQSGTAMISKYWRGVTGGPFGTWGDLFWEFDTSNRMLFNYYGANIGQPNYLPTSVAVGSPALATNTWYHCAAVRKDGNFSMFFEGRRIFYDTSGDAAQIMDNSYGSILSLGRRYSTSSGTSRHRTLDGWLDEVRITNGTAWYDGATYTVPTAPFPVAARNDAEAPNSPNVSPLPLSPQSPEPVPPAAPPSNWQPTNI